MDCYNIIYYPLELYDPNRETDHGAQMITLPGENGGDDGTGKLRSNAEFQTSAYSRESSSSQTRTNESPAGFFTSLSHGQLQLLYPK